MGSSRKKARRRPLRLYVVLRLNRPEPNQWLKSMPSASTLRERNEFEEAARRAEQLAEKLADRSWRGYGKRHDSSRRVGVRGRRVVKKSLPA